MLFNEEFKHIAGPVVSLDLILTNNGNDKELPYYWFNIVEKKTSKNVGKISLRVGHNYHSYFNGNIGYEVDEEYRGNNYAYHACLMVLGLAKSHDMKELYITCDYDNIASIKTIEKLDVDLVDEVVPPKDYVFYYEGIAKHKIYKIEL